MPTGFLLVGIQVYILASWYQTAMTAVQSYLKDNWKRPSDLEAKGLESFVDNHTWTSVIRDATDPTPADAEIKKVTKLRSLTS